MKSRYPVAFIFLLLCSGSSLAAEYQSIKPLLIQAIDAPGGKASGVLVGPVAEKFMATTGSSAPVKADVTTIKGFKQEGCKRLNVRLSQANVQAKDGRMVDFGIDYGINLCRDGNPPTEGMDLGAVAKTLGKQQRP